MPKQSDLASPLMSPITVSLILLAVKTDVFASVNPPRRRILHSTTMDSDVQHEHSVEAQRCAGMAALQCKPIPPPNPVTVC